MRPLPSRARPASRARPVTCIPTVPISPPNGRLFKLNAFTAGYAAKLPDIVNPFSFQTVGSFTHTQEDQLGGAGSGFRGNNNATNDWNAIYYTGRVTDKIGAYLQLNFNPQVTENISLAMAEIRYADHMDLAGSNLIYGVSANNGPTMSDTWMTVPEWMYPYNTSQLAPQPTAQPLMMQLMGFTAGSSAYAMWDNHVYVEAGAYTSMASNMANGLGVYSRNNPLIDGGAPYYRVFLQHITGPHVIMVGTYGMQANMYPPYNKSFGTNSAPTGTSTRTTCTCWMTTICSCSWRAGRAISTPTPPSATRRMRPSPRSRGLARPA